MIQTESESSIFFYMSAPLHGVRIKSCLMGPDLQTLESVDGSLAPDEKEILTQLIGGRKSLPHDFWENVAAPHIPWRYGYNLAPVLHACYPTMVCIC